MMKKSQYSFPFQVLLFFIVCFALMFTQTCRKNIETREIDVKKLLQEDSIENTRLVESTQSPVIYFTGVVSKTNGEETWCGDNVMIHWIGKTYHVGDTLTIKLY